MAEASLKDKTVHGVKWNAVDNLSNYIVGFVVSIVLARLLTPDDYGLLGIVAIFTAISEAIIGGGLSNALIRKKNVTEDDYNTMFIANMVMSLFLYIIIFFSAPFIALFFGREELILLTRVSTISIVFGALSMVQQTRLTKVIDFKTQTKITIIASLLSGVVGITMALLGCGVWSLAAQSLTVHVLRTICLWYFNHWMPKLQFSIDSYKELFGFGWKLMVSSLLNNIWKELYQVVVGKFYSPATLGQYTRAKHYSELFSKNLTIVIQRVTYPVLSEIQDDNTRMLSAYRRIIKITMFITAVCMLTLGAISEPLLYCMIGPQWHEASTYLPLICIAGSTYPLQAINLNMLQVQGRSDLYLGIEIAKKIVGLAPLFVGAFVGVMPMLYVNLVTCVISYFLNSYYSGKLIGYSSWMQIKDIAPSYGIAFIIALSVYFFKYLPISNWIILPVQIGVGITVFFVVCKQFKLDEYNEVKTLIAPMLKKFKK